MQNGKKPNHAKIHCQVEAAAVLFVLFYGELVQNCHRYLFPPQFSDHTPKKEFARFRQLSNVRTGFSSARNFLQTIILVAIINALSFLG
jgi:hypothetical protein